MTVIASEEQAEQIGKRVTGGKRDEDFTVFRYEQQRTRLTLFGIEIKATGAIIRHA